MTAEDVPQRVVAIVAETLNVPADRVTLSASLVDDLGAESIDFLDILFQLEAAFGITIPAEELWRGAKVRQPGSQWDREPAKATPSDQPRLITLQTILHYLQARGIS